MPPQVIRFTSTVQDTGASSAKAAAPLHGDISSSGSMVQDLSQPQPQLPKRPLYAPLEFVQDTGAITGKAPPILVALEQALENTDHALLDLIGAVRKFSDSTQPLKQEDVDAKEKLLSSLNAALDSRKRSLAFLTPWENVLERVSKHGEAPGQQTEQMARFLENNATPSQVLNEDIGESHNESIDGRYPKRVKK